jgi:hypothetical protein
MYTARGGVLRSVDTPEKIRAVPNQPRTKGRSIRVDDPEWDDLGVLADSLGTDRSKLINEFLRWYLRRPGAKLPDRPPARNVSTAGETGAK